MIKKIVLFTLFLLFVGFLAGCGGGGDSASNASEETAVEEAPPVEEVVAEAPTGDPVSGESLYQQSCLACHGADAKGIPNLGKDLTASEFVKGQTDAELLAFIKIGRPASDPLNTQGIDMPPKGGNPALGDEGLMDIIAFIRTLEE